MTWLLLILAIAAEVTATLSLKIVSDGGRWCWYIATVAGYAGSFALLSAVLRTGFPLGIAYGIWSAGGVAVTAAASRLLLKEALTKRMLLGILLIMVGVLLVEIGRSH